MQFRWTTPLLLASLGGCGLFTSTGKYSVYFQPYSTALNDQANETIHSAASFAQAHPVLPVVVTGYSAPPDPKQDVPGLSDQRADAVKQMLIADGVSPNRISTVGNGITDPQTLPEVSVRRVDIGVGP
jgi:outer membrane protein OmpA-like peptidoglycan-associated protein